MSRSRKTMSKSKKKAVPVKKLAAKKAKTTIRKKVSARRKTKKVLAIPKGYNTIIPCLIVNQAANAIEFYKKIFGAKEKMRIEQPNVRGKIQYSELQIGDSKLMLADECAKTDTRNPHDLGGSPVSMHLYTKNVDDTISRALKAGAKLTRPIENMFYGDRCGEVEDPYGYRWCIATHVENVSLAQMKKRMAKFDGTK